MRPNTPHLVVTPESSICHGGHFIATATLRQTCHGIFHTFIASSLLTNAEHTTASRDLLRRMGAYFWKAFQTDYVPDKRSPGKISDKYAGNIPNIFTFNGLLDIYSLCNVMELGNIIHFRTYTNSGLGELERKKMIEGRIISRQIRQWLACKAELHDSQKEPSLLSLEDDLFYPYLASQASALVNYKRCAHAAGAHGNSDFTFQDLESQIDGAFGEDPTFLAHYQPSFDPRTFDWTGTTFQVHPAIVGGYWPTKKPSGETPNDRQWREGRGKKIIEKLTGVGTAEEPIILVDGEESDLGSPRKRPITGDPPMSRKKGRTI